MLIGRRISGRYKLLKYIGGGGMANVYLARDIILERDVAVKILRLDFANNDDFIRRFHREAQSATSLSHPNIVDIYDVGEEGSIYYIVMEYVDGQTLKQFIQQNSPVSVDQAVDIMLQITSAIRHAHDNNIIHRDIKPQNILIDYDGNVKITDFGIAVALSSTTITQTNTVLGSVHYISPEQARGGLATKKSDIYSLGIVFFELLTGKLPFSGESAVSIAIKHLQSDTPHPRSLNPEIPQSVENIILKCTAKDPYYRYEDVEELREDLLTCLEPGRLNEPPFSIPEDDDEETKVIPVVKDPQSSALNKKKNDGKKKKGGNDKEKSILSKNRKKQWPFVFLIITALLILSGISFMTMDIFGKKDVEVPDVTNMPVEEAIKKLEESKFKVGDQIEQPNDEIPENFVIRTDPKAGRTKVEGSVINLYVSTGKGTITIDDYRGKKINDVLKLLEKYEPSFKDIEINEIYSDQEKGIIIDQDPKPDEQINPAETVLSFTVSKGQETVKVDDLTKYSMDELKNYAKSKGLVISVTDEEYSDSVPKGRVIRQNVKPGTEIKKGDTVNVTVSLGKKEKPPKTVTIDVSIAYTGNREMNEAQEVQIFIDDMNHDFSQPYDSFKIVETTRKRFDLMILPNSSARYKIIVDNEVVQDEVIPY